MRQPDFETRLSKILGITKSFECASPKQGSVQHQRRVGIEDIAFRSIRVFGRRVFLKLVSVWDFSILGDSSQWAPASMRDAESYGNIQCSPIHSGLATRYDAMYHPNRTGVDRYGQRFLFGF